jgi:formiminotetrahydrofolate cyclodeaminase
MDYAKETIEKYLDDAASDKPAPGGGSISALAGALAASMGEMAGKLTFGKKKFESVQQDVANCLRRLSLCRRRLMALMDADVMAYTSVNKAYGMPKGSAEEKGARKEAMRSALLEAMKVPLNIMRECCTVGDTAARLVKICNPNLLTDVNVCAVLAEAACVASRPLVEINLKTLKNAKLSAKTAPELDELTKRAARSRKQVSRLVKEFVS